MADLAGRDLKQRLTDLGHDMDHLRDVLMLHQHLLEQGASDDTEQHESLRSRFEAISVEHRRILREQARWVDQTADHFNPFWGSFFKQGSSKTRFSGQLETYACLYTSRVSNFAYYGTNRYFRVTRDPMMHELVTTDSTGL